MHDIEHSLFQLRVYIDSLSNELIKNRAELSIKELASYRHDLVDLEITVMELKDLIDGEFDER